MTQFIAPDSTSTDRFLLRSWQPGDGPAMQAAVVESYDHLAPWMPWATPDQTVLQSELNARRFRGNYLLCTDFCIAIYDPTNTRVLGGSGFHLREGGLNTRSVEIGMWIRGSEAGQGLGSAVLREMARWAFDVWPFDRLSWRCNANNHASCKTALNAGFTLEGAARGTYDPGSPERRTVHAYSRLRTDP